jgi:hypothetical protein
MPEDNWIFAALKKEWPVVKKFIIHLACFAAEVVCILFLYEKFVIPGMDGELHQKDETIRTISEERDGANRENEKLSKQIEELRIYRAQDTMPLKAKALILAKQIRDFTKDWKDTDSPNVQSETSKTTYNDLDLELR